MNIFWRCTFIESEDESFSSRYNFQNAPVSKDHQNQDANQIFWDDPGIWKWLEYMFSKGNRHGRPFGCPEIPTRPYLSLFEAGKLMLLAHKRCKCMWWKGLELEDLILGNPKTWGKHLLCWEDSQGSGLLFNEKKMYRDLYMGIIQHIIQCSWWYTQHTFF